MNRNLVKSILAKGGTITPLLISASDSNGLGLMNPSIFIDNGELKMILRNVNYTLYHCENEQTFNNRWGPLSYLNPENDIHLRTWNFLCILNKDTLAIERYWKIDTSKLDKPPIWEFVGLEDARLVRWNGSLYGIGVRRDTTTNGQGRMELSQIYASDKEVKEINRYRIEPPNDPNSYCEKNWMPIIDLPYTFVKWTNPTEVVTVDIKTLTSKTIYLSKETIPGLPFLRGSSQVIPWGKFRICLVHDCDLYSNRMQQKDATYMHRFIVWDKDWNIVRTTEPFSFMDGEIEFCCGMALYNEDLLITFGFQDNAAFILKVPKVEISNLLEFDKFDWGIIKENQWFFDRLQEESGSYERFFKVEQGDIVVDIGASVGPFAHSVLDISPSKIICIEPHPELFKTLEKNLALSNAICFNVGIAKRDGRFKTNNLFKIEEKYGSSSSTEIQGISLGSLQIAAGIDKIDFLKIDCEGAEYDVFTPENFDWIKKSVRKIAGEFHLDTPELKKKFRDFRHNYLNEFKNIQVISADGIDIKWDLQNEHFIEYYKNVMIYIDNRPKWSVTDAPSLEITTSIPEKGCPINCVFCPQDKLVKSYKSFKSLRLEDFKLLLDKVPKEIIIVFAGFTEPFLNKYCADMILYAHEKGHKISVFTTGVNLSKDDYDKIKGIPFQSAQGGFVLHLPDAEGYTYHPVEKYTSDLQKKRFADLLNYISEEPPSNFSIVTMGTLPEIIKQIFPNTIKQQMWSRAGNLERKEGVLSAEVKTNPCSCNCYEKLYHNVLLPNGDIVLCCMDYGLKNVLGNLFREEYEDIIPVNDTPFELCKHCENAKVL